MMNAKPVYLTVDRDGLARIRDNQDSLSGWEVREAGVPGSGWHLYETNSGREDTYVDRYATLSGALSEAERMT